LEENNWVKKNEQPMIMAISAASFSFPRNAEKIINKLIPEKLKILDKVYDFIFYIIILCFDFFIKIFKKIMTLYFKYVY
tara:strand:- start:897 stop:1133 length:237 start_codon:yes stop_codon:yes gene_type:complete